MAIVLEVEGEAGIGRCVGDIGAEGVFDIYIGEGGGGVVHNVDAAGVIVLGALAVEDSHCDTIGIIFSDIGIDDEIFIDNGLISID